VSLENLFLSWQEFKKGKSERPDVMEFELYLEDNIFSLHNELVNQVYRHGSYKTFYIQDPKPRRISKAKVRDRLVHHVVFNELYRLFNPQFIYHSYSSRMERGTHLAVKNLAHCLRKVSRNYTRPAYALKCDIRKFFDSVSHQKLLELIKNKIKDRRFLWLVEEIVRSFSVVDKIEQGGALHGLPIGNITSQIFANIYLNELDQFIKHKLLVKHYFRYADDFIIVHSDPVYLQDLLYYIGEFLKNDLCLELHPNKVRIRKLRQGIDFLGYVILPHHIVLRTKTRGRMLRKLSEKHNLILDHKLEGSEFYQSIQSYLGLLGHCNGHELSNFIKNNYLYFKQGD